MKTETKIPFLITSDDYFEFAYIQDILKMIIPDILVTEIDLHDYTNQHTDNGVYVAIVYLKDKMPDDTQIRQMVKRDHMI